GSYRATLHTTGGKDAGWLSVDVNPEGGVRFSGDLPASHSARAGGRGRGRGRRRGQLHLRERHRAAVHSFAASGVHLPEGYPSGFANPLLIPAGGTLRPHRRGAVARPISPPCESTCAERRRPHFFAPIHLAASSVPET